MKKSLLFLLGFILFLNSNIYSQAPVNDECASAISLTPNSSCIYTNYTTSGATASASVPAPGCASYSGGDVWFSVIVPASGSLTVNLQEGEMTDSGMAWYTGDCSSLVLLQCDDDNSENGLMSKITRSDLTPGSTIYIRVWEYGNDNLGTFGICCSYPPPPPSNDECSSPIVVPVNTDSNCTDFVSGTIESATQSLEVNSCDGTNNDDVWFIFQATSTSHDIGFSNALGSTTDLMIAVYEGNCGSLNQLSCNEFYGQGSSIVDGLTIGQNYYIRIYSWTSTGGQNTTFDVCVKTPPPAPVNNECNNAIALNVGTSCVYSDFTNESATASVGVTDPGCASYVTGDVWFSFVVPANGNVIVNSNTGTLSDAGMAWYTGSCPSLTLLECDDDDSENGNMPKISRTGLTPGETIFVRMWGYGSNNSGTFQICATEPSNPPANDECDFPVGLPVNPDNNCVSYASGTTENATASIQTNNCNGNADDDVWYSFTATNTSHDVNLSNITGNTTYLNHSIYTGSCASLGNALLCSDLNTSTISGLTIGNSYLIRVYSNSTNPIQTTSFDICVSTPPAPPSNDECSGAINLTVNNDCTFSTFTNQSSSSSSVADPGCASYSGGDIWFSFVAPTGGAVRINTETGVVLDGGLALYSGDCGNLNFIECDDDDSENGNMPSITRNDLIPGNTYYIRFWEYNNDNNGTFGICLSLPPAPPSNDECLNSINVTPSSNSSCVPIASTISGATGSVQTNNCSGTADDDVWYSFVANSTELNIDLLNINGNTTDLYHSVYDGTCANLGNSVVCSDPNSSNLVALTIGNTYLLRIYSWTSTSGQIANFDLCITNPNVSSPEISFGTITNPNSCSALNGSIEIIGTNTNIGTLSWTGTTSGSLNNITLPYIVTGLGQGNYTFVFNDGGSTTPIDTTLSDPQVPVIPTISANGPSTFCEGGYIILTSSSSSQYLWSNGSSSQSVNITSSGNYTVTVTENGCSSTSLPFSVTVNPNPVISLGITTNPLDCGQANGSIQILGNGTGALVWTGSYSGSMGSVVLNGVISNLNSGNYNVQFIDNNSCESNIVIANLVDPNAPPQPTITASGSTDICNGSSVTLTSSSLNGNTWSTGETTQSIIVSTAGIYTVTTTINSCVSQPSVGTLINVIPNVSPSISIASSDNDNQICTGSEIQFTSTITNGGSNPQYSWMLNGIANGITSNTFTSSTLNNNDVVSCVLTSNETCASPNSATSNSIVLSVQNSLTPSIFITSNDIDNDICAGTNVIFNATTINGGANPQFSWTINGELVGTNSNSFSTTTLNDGDIVNCYLISDDICLSTNLATSNSIEINVVSSLTPTISIASNSSDNTICIGSTITFNANINNGGTNPIYLWKINNNNVGTNSSSFSSSSLNNGDIISCTLTSNDQCATINTVNSNNITINVIATLTPSVSIFSNDIDNSICEGTNVTFTANSINAGANPSYSWFLNGNLLSSNSNSIDIATLTQNDVVYCQITSNESCANPNIANSNTINMSVNSYPIISLGNITNNDDCGGNSGIIEVEGSGNGILYWVEQSTGSINNINTTLPSTINNLITGNYNIYFDVNGCMSNTLITNITEPAIPSTPDITISGNTTFCEGESVTLSSSFGQNYLWSTNETTQNINVTTSGEYFVTVYNAPNCFSTSDTIEINVIPTPTTPVITVLGNTTFCEGESITLTSSSNIGNIWNNGNTTNSIIVTTSGSYFVNVTQNGCTSLNSDPINVTVNSLPIVTISSIADVCDTAETFILNQGSPIGGSYIINGNSTTEFNPDNSNIGLITVVYSYTQNSCTNTAQTTFNVLDCSNASLEEEFSSIKIYPNPTNGILVIDVSNLSKIENIKVYDAIGKLVLISESNIINLSNYTNGFYTLHINIDGKVKNYHVNLVK